MQSVQLDSPGVQSDFAKRFRKGEPEVFRQRFRVENHGFLAAARKQQGGQEMRSPCRG
jgi:hypothetical protein